MQDDTEPSPEHIPCAAQRQPLTCAWGAQIKELQILLEKQQRLLDLYREKIQRYESESGGGTKEDSAPSRSSLATLCFKYKGNVSDIARAVGRERVQVYRWLKRYDMDIRVYRT